MELKDILIFVLVTIVLVISLYRKHIKKKIASGKPTDAAGGTMFNDQPASEDSYEPYRKK